MRFLTQAQRFTFILALCLGLFHARSVRALTNGLALTPPMGWNSWYYAGSGIREIDIRQVTDTMATNGMRDAGYQYLVIDDCWQVARDASGRIVDGSPTEHVTATELWTFVRSQGGRWILSAIQQAR